MIERVDGLADPRLAAYSHVGDHHWLRRHALFVAEGRLLVQRLIDAEHHDIESIVVTPAALASLTEALARARCPVYVLPAPALASLTGIDFHRGCLAIARRSADEPRVDAFATANRLLVVEGVANPDNIGGLFRVAAAFDAAVLLDQASADPLYRKALRTSMGAALTVPFARVAPWPSGIEALRAAGFIAVALTPDKSAVPIETFAATLASGSRIVLMLGSEGQGLSDGAFAIADVKVRIATSSAVDSLNIVVAAGIALAMLAKPMLR